MLARPWKTQRQGSHTARHTHGTMNGQYPGTGFQQAQSGLPPFPRPLVVDPFVALLVSSSFFFFLFPGNACKQLPLQANNAGYYYYVLQLQTAGIFLLIITHMVRPIIMQSGHLLIVSRIEFDSFCFVFVLFLGGLIRGSRAGKSQFKTASCPARGF